MRKQQQQKQCIQLASLQSQQKAYKHRQTSVISLQNDTNTHKTLKTTEAQTQTQNTTSLTEKAKQRPIIARPVPASSKKNNHRLEEPTDKPKVKK